MTGSCNKPESRCNYQETKTGLLQSGTYLSIVLPVRVKAGDIVSVAIDFSTSGGTVVLNELNFTPLR